MKKMLTSLAFVASTLLMAGGDITPVELEPIVVIPETQKDFYVGGSTIIGVSDVTNTNDIEWFSFSTVGVQAGYTFYRGNDWDVSAEARYNTDVSDIFDTYNYGVYLKPGYNFDAVTAYGLVGYQDGHTNDAFDFDGELAYGLGLSKEYYGLDFFVDYLYGDKTESDVVTLGLNYKF